jgi:hypothetical protein
VAHKLQRVIFRQARFTHTITAYPRSTSGPCDY